MVETNMAEVQDVQLLTERRQDVLKAMYDKIGSSSSLTSLDSLAVDVPGLEQVKFSQLDEKSKSELRNFYRVINSNNVVQSPQAQPLYADLPRSLSAAIPPINQGMLETFAANAQKLMGWTGDMISSGIDSLKRPETWHNLQDTVVNFASGLVQNITSAMKSGWDEITSTLSDPQKRGQFIQRCISGQIIGDIAKSGFQLLGQGFDVVKNALIKFCEASGLSDLGRSVAALFRGDLEEAKKCITASGSKFAKMIGLTDLIEGISLIGQALAKDDPSLYQKALQHLVEGSFRIATTVFVVGKVAAAFRAGRAMLTSFMYRDVAQDAIKVAYNSIGKTSATEVQRQVTVGHLRQLGLNAGTELGKVTEGIVSDKIKDVVGRNVLAEGVAKLTAEESKRVTFELMTESTRKSIVSSVRVAAEEIGEKTTEKAITLAAENFSSSGWQAVKGLNPRNRDVIARFAEHCKKLGMKELKGLGADDVINLVKSELPSLADDQAARVARAVGHIANNNWHYSAAAKKLAMEEFSKGMTKELMENSLGQGFKEGWKVSLDSLEAKLRGANVDVDEIRPLLDDIARAGEEGFEAGVKKACLKFAQKLFEKKKKLRDTDTKKTKKKDRKTEDGTFVENEAKDNLFTTADEEGISAAQYGKMEETSSKWTYEKELALGEERKRLAGVRKSEKQGQGNSNNVSKDNNTIRDVVGSNMT